MKCKRCNYDNEDDAQKCVNCGMKLEPIINNTKKEEFQKPTVTVEVQSANTQKSNNDIKKMQMRKSENDYFQSQYRGPGSDINNQNNEDTAKLKASNIQKRQQDSRAINDYYLTEYKGPENQQPKVPKKGKKLWITVVLAILFVGFGHIYLKEYKKALIFILIAIITSLLSVKIAFFTIIGVFNTMYQLLDAINTYKSNYIS